MRRSADGIRMALSATAMNAVTYRCGAFCAYACQATDIDNTAACSANTFSSADMRSWYSSMKLTSTMPPASRCATS